MPCTCTLFKCNVATFFFIAHVNIKFFLLLILEIQFDQNDRETTAPSEYARTRSVYISLCTTLYVRISLNHRNWLQTVSAINIHVHVNFQHGTLGQEKCMFGSYFSPRYVKFEFNGPNQIFEYI
jgi:hypothetical protein